MSVGQKKRRAIDGLSRVYTVVDTLERSLGLPHCETNFEHFSEALDERKFAQVFELTSIEEGP